MTTPSFVEIPVYAKGGVVKYAKVDPEDAPRVLAKGKWYLDHGGRYARRNLCKNYKSYPLRMHRHILGLTPGDGKEVDHINGDGLDNRRENLRLVTNAQNLQNRRGPRKGSKTGVRNVRILRGRFVVEVANKHVGSFGDLGEASRAAAHARRAAGYLEGASNE